MSREIRNSAKAVIIKDGKLLAIKISDGREEWYILPGNYELLRGQTIHKISWQ